jgi:hypothetical protein
MPTPMSTFGDRDFGRLILARCKRGKLDGIILCAQLGERVGVWF